MSNRPGLALRRGEAEGVIAAFYPRSGARSRRRRSSGRLDRILHLIIVQLFVVQLPILHSLIVQAHLHLPRGAETHAPSSISHEDQAMLIDTFKDELFELGVSPEHPASLALIPISHVAWADGELSERKRRRIRRLAVHYDDDGTVEHWLRRPPAPHQVVQACRLLSRLALADDEHDLEPISLAEIAAHAEWVARAIAGVSDAPYAATPAESEAFGYINACMGVDMGCSWSELWRDLHHSKSAA